MSVILGGSNSPMSVGELRPHFPGSPGGPDGSGSPGTFLRPLGPERGERTARITTIPPRAHPYLERLGIRGCERYLANGSECEATPGDILVVQKPASRPRARLLGAACKDGGQCRVSAVTTI